jgi:tetratricopeptide (TPR) repeat protein
MVADNSAIQEKFDEAWEAYEKNNYDKAEQLCTSILLESPDLSHPHYLLGHINLDRKKFSESLISFETAVKKDSMKKKSGLLYYWIGRVYDEGGDLFDEVENPHYDGKKALEYYKLSKGNEDFPKDALLRIIQREKLDFEKHRLLCEGMEKFPDDHYFYINSSVFFEKELDYRSQIEELQKGLKNCEKKDAINYFIGKYYQNRRQYSKARHFYLETIKSLSNKENLYGLNYLIANCYCEDEDYLSAEIYYKKNLEPADAPNFKALFSTIGIIPVLLRLNKQSEIESQIERLQFDSLITGLDLGYGMTLWLDSNVYDDISLYQDGEETTSILKTAIFKNKKKQFEINLNILKIILFRHRDELLERLKAANQVKNIAKGQNVDFVFFELAEAYGDYFLKADESVNIDNEVAQMINDIKKYPDFKEEAFNSIDHLIEGLYDKKKYNEINELALIYNYIQSDKTESLFKIAYSINECGDRKTARRHYEKILALNPLNSSALNNLGVVYENEGSYEQALKFYKSAQKKDPEKELYKNNLNRCLKLRESKIEEDKKKKIPEKWTKYTASIKMSNLNDLEYFEIVDRVKKVNQKYKLLIERDVNELFFNHIVHNDKASIVLSGSLIELLLTYYCEKKGLKILPIKDASGASKDKKLYDCVLSDLISFCESKKFFGSDFPHLGNLSRIYRNYIHPGRELKESINRAKAELCFISTKELLKKILS